MNFLHVTKCANAIKGYMETSAYYENVSTRILIDVLHLFYIVKDDSLRDARIYASWEVRFIYKLE